LETDEVKINLLENRSHKLVFRHSSLEVNVMIKRLRLKSILLTPHGKPPFVGFAIPIAYMTILYDNYLGHRPSRPPKNSLSLRENGPAQGFREYVIDKKVHDGKYPHMAARLIIDWDLSFNPKLDEFTTPDNVWVREACCSPGGATI
jgi:hypothetical protein